MFVTVAFYKGRATAFRHRLEDAIIRWGTRGMYSHVELIAGKAELGREALCLSSSGRDGGVRAKRIVLKPASWDLLELNIDPDGPTRFIRDRIGARYDYRAIFLSQMIALGQHREDCWFCSEIVAKALGMPRAHRISPQMLFDLLSWHESRR